MTKQQEGFIYGISEKIIYSRALQSVIWGVPAVNYEMMYQAFVRAGGFHNQIAYSNQPGHWKNQLITPNADAVFVLPFFNTEISGPVVLEIPKSGEFSLVGTVFSCWQLPLQDVGSEGTDQGNGGHYLILPPDYKDIVPSQYTIVCTPNFQGYALLRCIPKTDKDVDFARAIIYMEQIKLYPLSSTEIHMSTQYVDLTDKYFDAAIQYDIAFFESLNRVVQQEPWLERDLLMVDILKETGIIKGKSFFPDSKMKVILQEAVNDAKEFLDMQYDSYTPFFINSKWFFPAEQDLLNSWKTGFKEKNSYPIDARSRAYYRSFGGLKQTDAEISQFYLYLIHDQYGNRLDGNKVYKLIIPPEVPVTKYWSLTVYNRSTHTFIHNVSHSNRSSLNRDLKINDDASITIYLSPSCLDKKQSNWIPTRENENFELIFRFYGVGQSLLEKKWILPDLQIVND